MAELEVIIGGDSKDLDKEILKVEKELKRLESQKQTNVKLGIDTANLDKSISSTKSKLDGLKSSLNTTSVAANTFNKATANGSNTLTQFSRIAQDAPFGIMGIGNNLTATAESFANLSRSAGGATNALKAVGSSLLGGGGVLLAISLVTTGLTYMSQSGLTVGDVFDKLTGNFDKLGQSMNQVAVEAAKNSSEEITSFKALVSVAKDVNTSMEKRLIAVQKLQEQYPAYFGNLSKEQILNGDVSTATNELAKAIIAKAKAQAYSNKISELAQKSLENEIAAEKLRKQEAQQKTGVGTSANNQAAAQFGGATAYASGVQAANSALANTRQKIKDLIDANKENARVMEIYANEVNKAADASILLEKKSPKTATKAEKVKTPKVKVPEFDAGNKYLVALNTAIQEQVSTFDWSAVEVEPPMQLKLTGVQEEFLRLQGLVTAFSQEMDSLITDSVSNGLGNLGNAIGNALSTGGNVLNAVGNSLLASLGSFLSDMGGLLIKYGTLAIIKGKLDLAIAAGGPAAIGAGIAAVAVGVALKAAGAAIGNAARGGATGGGGGGTTGRDYSSPASTVSTGGGGGFTNGSVVFEISGTSLIGVLSNSLDKNSRLGGALGI